jgi:hypothetical protein
VQARNTLYKTHYEGDDRDLLAAVLDTIMGVIIRIAASNSKCTREIIAKVHDKMMGQYIKNRADVAPRAVRHAARRGYWGTVCVNQNISYARLATKK